MSKKIICSLFYPIIKKFGVCENLICKVERARGCPHLKMRVQFEHRSPKRGSGL